MRRAERETESIGDAWHPVSRFWDEALAPRADDEQSQRRQQLRSSLKDARDAVSSIAAAIEEDLPQFTVHDATHIDALWPLVDLIASRDLRLTPTEVWTLGVAILLHDLGLAVATYPGGRVELRALEGWPDALASAIRHRLERTPTLEEIANPEPQDLEQADQALLRARHASRAADLAMVEFGGRALVADEELRSGLGELAGRIAASHWWPATQLVQLGPLCGAPAGMPADWSLRPALLGALLRTADAAHLDALRAPKVIRARRELSDEAAKHWDFQQRLAQPVLDGEQLRFSSTEAFGVEQSEAWWTCVDHLRLLDAELAASNAVLADLDQPLLAVRSVADVRDPMRLAQMIRINGWLPVDTRIEISDVPRLVQALGGERLYDDPSGVPLRELIQNASDAVRARQALEPGFRGAIEVRLTRDMTRIEVIDNGVGMEDRVLTGALLDFGRSLWSSSELASVHPGLQARGFQPTGRFGVGFFSSFMWSERVTVISRARSAARDETRVLSFSGLGARPILRGASEDERLNEPGTVVILDQAEVDEFSRDALTGVWVMGKFPGKGIYATMTGAPTLLEWLAPALPVDLRLAIDDGDPQTVIVADDWRTLDPETLRGRLGDYSDNLPPLEDLHSGGTIVGRLALVESLSGQNNEDGRCVLVSGGLRVGTSAQAVGLLTVDATNVARSIGVTSVTAEETSRWASSQARLIPSGDEDTRAIAANVLELGGDPADLHLVSVHDGLLCYASLLEWIGNRRRIYLIDVQSTIEESWRVLDIPRVTEAYEDEQEISLAKNVINTEHLSRSWPRKQRALVGANPRTVPEVVQSAIVEAWGDTAIERRFVHTSRLLTAYGRRVSCHADRWSR